MLFTHDDPVLVLDEEQSWKLLENTRHGRPVLTAAGETDIFPINYRAHDGVLLLRTAPGTKLAELTMNDVDIFSGRPARLTTHRFRTPRRSFVNWGSRQRNGSTRCRPGSRDRIPWGRATSRGWDG
jgi:hypothetical protein